MKYIVTMSVRGRTSFIIEAESPEAAQELAFDRFDDGDDGEIDTSELEHNGTASVREAK